MEKPSLRKTDLVVSAFNLSTQEAADLYEFKASLSYLVRSCLNKTKNPQQTNKESKRTKQVKLSGWVSMEESVNFKLL